jgi:hypothetical protein
MRSLHFPGIVAILIAVSSITLPSCSNNGNSNTLDKSAPIVFDSIRKLELDSMAMHINDFINAKGLRTNKIPYPVYNPTDSIGYLLTEEHHARISMNTHPDSSIVWPYFWVYNGNLIIIRLRKYQNVPENRSASETVIYFDQGRIVYCNERKKMLGEKEIAGAVQNEPFVKSQRTYGDVEQEANKYWTEVCNEMKKQKVLPGWIKF